MTRPRWVRRGVTSCAAVEATTRTPKRLLRGVTANSSGAAMYNVKSADEQSMCTSASSGSIFYRLIVQNSFLCIERWRMSYKLGRCLQRLLCELIVLASFCVTVIFVLVYLTRFKHVGAAYFWNPKLQSVFVILYIRLGDIKF